MSLITPLVSGGLRRSIPIVPSVAQDRVIGAHMNSTWWHSSSAAVPIWLHRMCVADGGKTMATRGDFDAFGDHASPPTYNDDNIPEITVPSSEIVSYTSWAEVNADGYTDTVYVTDNFQGPPTFSGDVTDPNSTDADGLPPVSGAGSYVSEFIATITDKEANHTIPQNHWLYEIWGNGGLDLNADGSGTAQQFADWRSRTTDSTVWGGTPSTSYSNWFDTLLADTKANFAADVADRIKMIPVARMWVDVMENTSASALGSDDWFEDTAPHGLGGHGYCVAAAVVYSCIFQEVAPTPDFTGHTFNSTVSSNWSEIATRIYDQLVAGSYI